MTEQTTVVFRRWRNADRSVIALFPEVPADLSGSLCSSYEHTGQHGAASPEHVMVHTRQVGLLDPEVVALHDELEHIGYVLTPLQRMSPAHRTRRRDAARSLRAQDS